MATSKTSTSEKVAVISLMGKQFVVKEGDKIKSEKVDIKEGEDLKVKEVLLLSTNGAVKIGTPFVDGATVSLTHDKLAKDDKVEINKFKAKSRYRRSTGHRQTLSHLTVKDISL